MHIGGHLRFPSISIPGKLTAPKPPPPQKKTKKKNNTTELHDLTMRYQDKDRHWNSLKFLIPALLLILGDIFVPIRLMPWDAKKKLSGTKQIPSGTKKMLSGTKQITSGTKQIPSGTKQIPNGTKQISSDTKQMPSGTKQMPIGTK
jgi:hypothetical protein